MKLPALAPPTVMLRRTWNRLLAHACNRLQTTKVVNKPVNVIIEMSSACNLKCPLCNTGGLKKHFSHVQRGNMSFETFKTCLDKLLPEVESVMLYNWGEPFLNKDLLKCVAYATRHRVFTSMSTNMTLYKPELGEGLVEAGLGKLIVSCDGLTQETYEQYRTGGLLDDVVRNTEHLIELKRRAGSKRPHIQMQFIVFRHNEHEMEEFERLWTAKGADSVNFIRMSFMSKLGQQVAEERKMVPDNTKFSPHFPYGSLKRCSDPYTHVSINYNGDWYTCCFPSGETDYRVANLVTDDFWSVWNGPYYRYSRELIRTQKVPDGQGGKIQTMCHDCTGVYPDAQTKKYWSLSLPVEQAREPAAAHP